MKTRDYIALLFGLLVVVVVGVRGQRLQQQQPDCQSCDRSACEKVRPDSCAAGILLDECGCCHICARSLQQSCGGELWRLGRCGMAYYCQGPNPSLPINIGAGEVGQCQCRESKRVCGTDGIVHDSVCALNETSFEEQRYGGNKIEIARDRSICQSAPRIKLVAPGRNAVVLAGNQVYMQCEGDGFPTPRISWSKEGVILPGDHTNIAVQTIGGPQENQATGWLLISPVSKEDGGAYTCEVTNGVGDGSLFETVQLSVTVATDAQ